MKGSDKIQIDEMAKSFKNPFAKGRCEKIMQVPSCRTWGNIKWPSQAREPEALRLAS
jgi:hypothetical protein